MDKLAIAGASGHGRVVADIARKNGYEKENIFFLDDNEKVKTCGGYPVLGKPMEAGGMNADIVVAIGNAGIRRRMMEAYEKENLNLVTLVHPDAVVAEDVEIGTGTVVMAGVVINSGTRIGKGCIINTCSSVDHDCEIGDYVHISVGAHVAGTVKIGRQTWIGAGAVVSNNIEIGAECMVGSGAVVVKDLMEEGTYTGVPARKR